MGTRYELKNATWTSYPMLQVEYKSIGFFGSTRDVSEEISEMKFIGMFGKSNLPKLPSDKVPLGSIAFELDQL